MEHEQQGPRSDQQPPGGFQQQDEQAYPDQAAKSQCFGYPPGRLPK